MQNHDLIPRRTLDRTVLRNHRRGGAPDPSILHNRVPYLTWWRCKRSSGKRRSYEGTRRQRTNPNDNTTPFPSMSPTWCAARAPNQVLPCGSLALCFAHAIILPVACARPHRYTGLHCLPPSVTSNASPLARMDHQPPGRSRPCTCDPPPKRNRNLPHETGSVGKMTAPCDILSGNGFPLHTPARSWLPKIPGEKLQKRSRSSAALHMTPELQGPDSNPRKQVSRP